MEHMTYSPGQSTLLIDLPTGLVLALDSQAAANLDLSIPKLGSKLGPKPGSNPGLDDLRTLFPELTKENWAVILAPENKEPHDFTTLLVRYKGREQSVKLLTVPLFGPSKDLLLITIQPISPLAITKQNTHSHRDALTGLPDRRELVPHHQRWLQTAGEKPPAFAVLFLDLDHFKQINDQHGHAVGDQVLTTLAQRWQGCVRDGDLVTRYGGDEFVVLLANIQNHKDAEPAIARLTQVTSDPIFIGDLQLAVGVTIGVALSDGDSSSLEELIAAADQEMYALKRNR